MSFGIPLSRVQLIHCHTQTLSEQLSLTQVFFALCSSEVLHKCVSLCFLVMNYALLSEFCSSWQNNFNLISQRVYKLGIVCKLEKGGSYKWLEISLSTILDNANQYIFCAGYETLNPWELFFQYSYPAGNAFTFLHIQPNQVFLAHLCESHNVQRCAKMQRCFLLLLPCP